jgi:hypothetical protein
MTDRKKFIMLLSSAILFFALLSLLVFVALAACIEHLFHFPLAKDAKTYVAFWTLVVFLTGYLRIAVKR